MKMVKRKRQMTARQLANLRPAKSGEVRNPLGINRGRTYSDRYEEVAISPLPEKIRLKINQQLGQNLLPKGTTWAQANALRRHIGAVVEGNTADAKEIREAVEGKAIARMEVTGAEGKDLMPTSGIEALSDEQLHERWLAMEKVVRGNRKWSFEDPPQESEQQAGD
jgi:hypothetical protein